MDSNVIALPPLKKICAWCSEVLREGRAPVSHGICESCARDVQAGINPQRWDLPDNPEFSDDWKDSWIALQLADVLSRRYYGQPFKRLSVEDRLKLRGACESFIGQMTYRHTVKEAK